jgi:hypothetical protein
MKLAHSAGSYSFEDALLHLRVGKKLARVGWNGTGLFIFLVPEEVTQVDSYDRDTSKLVGVYAEGVSITTAARINMRYANGKIGPWNISHEDILARDWRILT